MKKTICIQTALPETEIVFLNDTGKRSKSFPASKSQSEELFKVIHGFLKDEKPDQILMVSGPGSFTGLRVGVTAGNALAFALQIPIAKINTFEYLRARASNNLPVALPGGREIIWQENADAEVEFLDRETFDNKLKNTGKVITTSLLDLPLDKKVSLEINPEDAFLYILQDKDLEWNKQVEPDYFRGAHITMPKK